MKINMSATREKYPLSFKKVYKKTIPEAIALAIITLFIGYVVFAATENIMSFFIWFAVPFVLITGLIYLYQKWYFAVYYYELTPDYVVIKKDPITPKEITIPYERVQDVYMDQDILDRIFGLYDVHLSSATISSGMAAHIDGLPYQHGQDLKNDLLGRVSQKINPNRAAQAQTNQPEPQINNEVVS